MLEVKIILNPFGNGVLRTLREIKIINDGTGTEQHGNYAVKFFDGKSNLLHTAEIKNHPRDAEVLTLVKKACETFGKDGCAWFYNEDHQVWETGCGHVVEDAAIRVQNLYQMNTKTPYLFPFCPYCGDKVLDCGTLAEAEEVDNG